MSPTQVGSINKDTWMNVKSDHDRNALLFDMLASIYETQKCQPELCQSRYRDCNKRMKKIENRKFWNTTASGITGLVGGFLAGWLRKLI